MSSTHSKLLAAICAAGCLMTSAAQAVPARSLGTGSGTYCVDARNGEFRHRGACTKVRRTCDENGCSNERKYW